MNILIRYLSTPLENGLLNDKKNKINNIIYLIIINLKLIILKYRYMVYIMEDLIY